MDTKSLPPTHRVWKYSASDGGMEKHLRLHSDEALPRAIPHEHLIRVLAVGLNPVDFKPAEAPLIGRFAVSKPATPGIDFAGRIVQPASNSELQPGQLVYGATSANPLTGGALAEYIAVSGNTLCPLPDGVSPVDAAGTPVAALTALTALQPYIRPGSRVFINGGSGGVGTYTIQVAKALGAHVTASCSGRNAELCRSLGADRVLDYTARPILDQLRDVNDPFDHVVDNVFADPALYFEAHTYTTARAAFVEVASGPSLKFIRFALKAFLLPAFLGGGRRRLVLVAADVKAESLRQISAWIEEQTIRTVTDSVFAFDDVREAYERLKTGRACGKVVVRVAREA